MRGAGSSRVWARIVLASYVLATLLSWMQLTPSLGRTIVRVVLMTWISVSTGYWLILLRREPATADLWRSVRRTVIAVGLCGALATPMFSRDLREYAAFARLTAGGANPYVTHIPDSMRAEFGLGSYKTTMPYGPAWAYGAAALDLAVAPLGQTAEITAITGVLIAAWTAMIAGVSWLQRRDDLGSRIGGLAAMSVVPISVLELVAEAHNDVVVMALVVWWLVLRDKGSWLGPVPLGLSIGVKYVTAPLLLFAAIEAWRRRRYKELACALATGIATLAVGLFFWQDGALVAGLTNNAEWRWLSAPFAIELTVKNLAPVRWVEPMIWLWRGLLALGVGWYLRKWWQSPENERAAYRVLAVFMLAVLLSAGYLWPWYLVWALPFVILAKDRLLSALAWPLFFVLPIAHAGWAGGQTRLGYRTEFIMLLLWGIALAWLGQAWLARRHPLWRDDSRSKGSANLRA